jgi:hypothetical protein
MAPIISHEPDGSVTVRVNFTPAGSMLESELALQAALNAAGAAATGECLRRFDADGAPVEFGGRTLTAKRAKVPKTYQCPYGEVSLERFVYQSSKGGRVFCPLEHGARVVRTATPLFARQVSFKYAHGQASEVVADFAEHGRELSRSYVLEVGSDVAAVAAEKEGAWTHAVPEAPEGSRVKTVSVGVDGACALFCAGEGWRQVMAGTIAFYDEGGERLATTYVARAPEAGKAAFFAAMERELAAVRERYPGARYAGVADGAADGWEWLSGQVEWQVLDFWHAAEYVGVAAPAFARGAAAQAAWAEEACHRLKHSPRGAAALLRAFKRKRREGVSRAAAPGLEKAITYFTNQLHRMNYHLHVLMDLPIGSGVTEAACKTIVKARLGGSGMRWTTGGAQAVLDLRAMAKSAGRWESFWSKISQYGISKVTRARRPGKKGKGQGDTSGAKKTT